MTRRTPLTATGRWIKRRAYLLMYAITGNSKWAARMPSMSPRERRKAERRRG